MTAILETSKGTERERRNDNGRYFALFNQKPVVWLYCVEANYIRVELTDAKTISAQKCI